MEPFIVAWAVCAAVTLGGAANDLQKEAQEKAEQEALFKHMEIVSYEQHGRSVHETIQADLAAYREERIAALEALKGE